jgi:hypothetical protein
MNFLVTRGGKNDTVTILMPVFNDWDSLGDLLKEISELHSPHDSPILKIVIVNDESSQRQNLIPVQRSNLEVEIINLKLNLGHQRAIAVGLCYISEKHVSEKIIVLDSDGEDNPFHFKTLMDKQIKYPEFSVVASRGKRLEKIWFRFFYRIFKSSFYLLTGVKLDFGNFTLLTRPHLKKLVLMSELWNNYPAAILKSKIKIIRVPIAREKRKFGKSKLSFVNFIQHGFSAISVFSEAALIRILIFSILLEIFLIAAIVVIFALRFFSSFTLPGWSSLVLTTLVSTTLLVTLFVLLSIIQYTGRRNRSHEFPIDFYLKYISTIEKPFL